MKNWSFYGFTIVLGKLSWVLNQRQIQLQLKKEGKLLFNPQRRRHPIPATYNQLNHLYKTCLDRKKLWQIQLVFQDNLINTSVSQTCPLSYNIKEKNISIRSYIIFIFIATTKALPN